MIVYTQGRQVKELENVLVYKMGRPRPGRRGKWLYGHHPTAGLRRGVAQNGFIRGIV
jgi:hypothetical protein